MEDIFMNYLKTIDHFSFAVKDLEVSKKKFCDVFGAEYHFQKEFSNLKAVVAFFSIGDRLVTMEQPLSPESPFAKFLEKRGEGLHHVCFAVNDLDAYIAHLESNGVKVVNKQLESKVRREAVVVPKDAFGTILQIVEWNDDYAGDLEKKLEFSRTELEIPG